MLSEEEKREMLEDGRSKLRRRDFRLARKESDIISFEDYLSFLNNIQVIFSPFKIGRYITFTKLNKL